ncbi:MAG: hypothetical protein NUW01_12755, partial [Gemmatimonadaceae bacterium]|nr:hypothetical protein [Gemmatimonadaceae bacterium]
VECKVSRSDFLANSLKPHVASDTGMGRSRWYMVPAHLVEAPEVVGDWGLLWCYQGKVRVIKEPSGLARDGVRLDDEIAVLVGELRNRVYDAMCRVAVCRVLPPSLERASVALTEAWAVLDSTPLKGAGDAVPT